MSWRKFSRLTEAGTAGGFVGQPVPGGCEMSRDAEHYRLLIEKYGVATIGFATATNAVYAAKFGACDTEHITDQSWLMIALRLKKIYGNRLTADQVLAEMESSRSVGL